ncbi:ABC transporter permease [Idiomarina sp. M1R2S28]|uniref:ABC transporter permease n=1 Tax=Idiomarina rhizosphaerae TaxID=2961572 RepID=A0A9X2FUL2_9GAMM|nr:ABC transporter permease [Idiomarina rhizosphaerae]MCP1339529.1 ABC transporter permease [Idiomarina rhizosphaerae]
MTRYLLGRLSVFIIAVFLLTVFSFSLNYLFPGDPITNMSGIRSFQSSYPLMVELRGGDQNLAIQYLSYLQHLFAGDWGLSLSNGTPVFADGIQHFMASIELILLALLVAVFFGLPLGVFAASRFRQRSDQTVISLAMVGYSIPVFWLAQLMILLFAIKLGWFPITGQINPLYGVEPQTGSILIDVFLSDSEYKAAALQDALNHIVLPVIILAIMPMMLLLRLMRNATQEMLQKPFVKAARARGLNEFRVLVKHAIPNAVQSVLQQTTLIFSLLLTNSIVVESIFNWPGMGNWLIRSIFERDYPTIQAAVLMFAFVILFFNLLVELYHGWRFPIVRHEQYATR